MYSTSDFEKLWFLYQTEGSPKGVSINTYCFTLGIPYTQFYDWLRKRQKPVVKVEVEGLYVRKAPSLRAFIMVPAGWAAIIKRQWWVIRLFTSATVQVFLLAPRFFQLTYTRYAMLSAGLSSIILNV